MSKGKLLAVCIVWLLIIAALAVTWRLVINPTREDRLIGETGSESQYDARVQVALDSFSGYAILRSDEFRDGLAKKKIRLVLRDDAADYAGRLKALDSGRTDMAVFTIDALLKVSDQMGETPATIVAVIDETRGADAVVAYESKFPNVDALNHPETRFVLTPDSPSETLARVIMSQFQLDRLPSQPFISAEDAVAVYKRFRTASQNDPHVYVVWEPLVSKMRQNPNTIVLASTENIRGYIVDVLVASRRFLLDNPEVVQEVLAAYFRTAFEYRNRMEELVLADAKRTETPLSAKEAAEVAKGIVWRNTQENFAHMGLSVSNQLETVEDMIVKISSILQQSGAISGDPTRGHPENLYHNRILAELKSSNFYPGLAQEEIRDESIVLPTLSKQEWDELEPVGTYHVPTLVFARGTARLTSRSQLILDRLVTTLRSSPQYYLSVQGNASLQGDLEANQALAESRAAAVAKYLIEDGIDKQRVRAEAGEPTGDMSVTFVLGQPHN